MKYVRKIGKNSRLKAISQGWKSHTLELRIEWGGGANMLINGRGGGGRGRRGGVAK